jgi:hypothetical protein
VEKRCRRGLEAVSSTIRRRTAEENDLPHLPYGIYDEKKETDEMKSEIENYRRNFKEATPIPSNDDQARNLEFQK